ncbi:LRR receptor serine/threonine-protein kinase [Spatholobus suberectus]|nr:LRR receptor serine/threonine-protein kinase [Spatholobus suberectus]
MERAVQWILVLAVCASSIIIDAAEIDELADRKLAHANPDVISIDCGVNEGYTDSTTNLQYQADDIQVGQIHNISSNYSFGYEPQIQRQLASLRSFPDGKRNCYTLKPKQGKDNRYLIRAYFGYGNYDNKNILPTFDLYVGVTMFNTAKVFGRSFRSEAIYFTSTDTIDFCLVNTDKGVPFISLLELWPLDSTIYQTSFTLRTLDLKSRINLGASSTADNFYLS